LKLDGDLRTRTAIKERPNSLTNSVYKLCSKKSAMSSLSENERASSDPDDKVVVRGARGRSLPVEGALDWYNPLILIK
jgi:hypothetical protein